MNAGAFGGEIRDRLVWAEAVDGRGTIHRAAAEAMGLAYRHSAAPDDWIFVRACFRGRPDDVWAIRARMASVQSQREASQPLRTRTGGSPFKNPDRMSVVAGKSGSLRLDTGVRRVLKNKNIP